MAQRQDIKCLQKKLVEFITQSDPLFSMLEWLMNTLMQMEAESKVGAQKNKHNKDRQTYFSGYRPRRFDTRLGTVYLMVPKLRNGGYIPFFLTEKKRSEQAMIQVIQEAFINGVSTRKVERLAKALGIESLSASQVSEINKGLDEQVNEFRNRPLDPHYPVIWLDALYEKIRMEGRVINMAIMVVAGVNVQGEREILSVEPFYEESEAAYTNLINKLKDRGLEKVNLAVSDAHKGLVAAISKNFLGASWQRCKFHFMRNIMATIPNKLKKEFGAKLKQIWLQPDRKMAMKYARSLAKEHKERFPDAVETLMKGLEDSLAFYSFEKLDPRKISSTNMLERLNEEIRRRSKVVGVFPSSESYMRLICSYLIEYAEDWSTGRLYFKPENLEEVDEKSIKVA